MSRLKSTSSYQTPQKSLELDDFIEMQSHIELPKKLEKPNNEYPPPMPCYSRPWGTNKYITSDGRLIIEQNSFDLRQQIHAKRSFGRLRLTLVTTIRHACDSGEGSDDDDGEEDEECLDDEVVEDEELKEEVVDNFGVKMKGIEKGGANMSSSYSFFEMPGDSREIQI